MVFGRIIMTFTCAIFGAVFGYMLGLFIGLFPGLNPALAGAVGMSIPALLAAMGFAAGLALGILAMLTMTFVRHDVYVWPWYRRMRRVGSSGYGNAYARHGRHGFGCSGERYAPGARSVEDALQEIDGYLSYLEDMPKGRLASCEDKLRRLGDRLASLRASMPR